MERLNSQYKIKIGTDIVFMPRLQSKLADDVWIQRILTPHEQALFMALKSERRKLEFLSGRFAAKEAYSKACGVGIGALDFKDIEILKDAMGKPISPLMDVSISHDHEYAIAMVVVYESF